MSPNDLNQTSERLSYQDHGCEIHRSPLTVSQLELLKGEVQALTTSPQPGLRNALEESALIHSMASSAFGLPDFSFQRILRCIIFDKSPTANWKIGWHQDLNIKEKDGTWEPAFLGATSAKSEPSDFTSTPLPPRTVRYEFSPDPIKPVHSMTRSVALSPKAPLPWKPTPETSSS